MKNKLFIILVILLPINITCGEVKEQIFAFSKGLVLPSVGLLAGYVLGHASGHRVSAAVAGAACGALLDHYVAGGKNDPRIARKIGNVLPIVVGGAVVYYHIDMFLFIQLDGCIRFITRSRSGELARHHLNDISIQQGYTETDIGDFLRLRMLVFNARNAQYEETFRQRFGFIITDASVTELLNQCDRADEFGVSLGVRHQNVWGNIMELIKRRNEQPAK